MSKTFSFCPYLSVLNKTTYFGDNFGGRFDRHCNNNGRPCLSNRFTFCPKIKSIPLADVRHAVANDHSYAAFLNDSPIVPAEQVPRVSDKNFPNCKRTLDLKLTRQIFLKLTAKKRKLKMSGFHPMSDHEESDMSDLSDYEVNEYSESFDSEDEDFEIKTEIPDDDEEKESTNWLNEDCGDLH